jgi:hypothetical protein
MEDIRFVGSEQFTFGFFPKSVKELSRFATLVSA